MRFPKAFGLFWLMIFALLALSVPVAATARDEDEGRRRHHHEREDVDDQDDDDREEHEGREEEHEGCGCHGARHGDHDKDCCPFFCGFTCATVIWLLLALWIWICVWVYRDATAREMESPVVWVILLMLAGLIGLVIYLIVRPPLEE